MEAKKVKSCKRLMNYTLHVVGIKWGLSPEKVLWVYMAMVRPVMVYGALVWCHNLAAKLTNKITRVQRMCLLAMIPALRSTPTAGLEVMMGMRPLQPFIQGEAAKARLRTGGLCRVEWMG